MESGKIVRIPKKTDFAKRKNAEAAGFQASVASAIYGIVSLGLTGFFR